MHEGNDPFGLVPHVAVALLGYIHNLVPVSLNDGSLGGDSVVETASIHDLNYVSNVTAYRAPPAQRQNAKFEQHEIPPVAKTMVESRMLKSPETHIEHHHYDKPSH